jgi:hypothetical protein
MARQSVLWTVLPNRYSADGESLHLSVLVAPRLDPDVASKRLSTFPDFVDWPATVAASRFTISFGSSVVTIAGNDLAGPNRVDATLATGDSATWKALLPRTTFVRPFAFRDLSSNTVMSYDVGQMESLVRGLYTKLAAADGDGLPGVSSFLDDAGWRALVEGVRRNDIRFGDEDRGLRNPKGQLEFVRHLGRAGALDLPEHLARFQAFHTPPSTPTPRTHTRKDDPRITAEWLEYKRSELPAEADFAKQIDFHQIVAAMNQYPTLLRRLGLVVDFVVDATAFTPAAKALLRVAVELPAPTPAVQRLDDASPQTRATLTKSLFEADTRTSPATGDYRTVHGLLELGKQFRLVQADVDGAGLKVINFARSLARMDPAEERFDPTTRFEREVGAPALRNAGLMLVHSERGTMLKNTFARNKDRDDTVAAIQKQLPGSPPQLFAEDLVRGYRVDIWDQTTKVWRSLCRRVSRYTIDGGTVVVDVPEEEGTARLAATKSPDPASNQDLVYLHEVVTSWNGWSLCAPQPGKAIDKQDAPGPADQKVPAGLPLHTRFAALAGSLPRLRYGRSYWLRARVVDLAGNSLAPQDADFGPEAPAKNATPYLRLEPIPAPATALVRGGGGGPVEEPAEGESMHRLAIRSFNVTPADNAIPTTQRARRFAVPARTNVREAEQHGMLDAGGKVDAGAYAMLVARDKALDSIELDTSGPLADPAKTTFAVLEEGAQLPYLPEPLATIFGARIFDLPDWPDANVIPIPVYPGSAWPDAAPFKVEIVDDPGASPTFDDPSRTLRIPLPKGVRASVRLSVAPTDEQLALLAVWSWLGKADQTKQHSRALRGQHWMLTPWRTLELVHAVQKPLIEPNMKLGVDRGYGETSARPTFVADVSLKSTDHVDLRADWHEPVDDPAQAAGEDRARSDTAFAVKITDEKSYASRLVDPKFTGIPEHEILKPDVIRAGGIVHDLITPKIHEFHDTRYRRIEYWLEATTCFREYMPASVLTKMEGAEAVPTDEQIKVLGERVTTWIPSSGPPAAPEVLYVVPTYGWVRTEDGQGIQRSWRRGSGLRVYLNRPWNGSGYGEMLAVVLLPASFQGDPDPPGQPDGTPAYKSIVTQWGNDPIWASPFVNGAGPPRGAFPLARTAPDPTGAWLPAFAPATESDQPPGPFPVTGLQIPGLPLQVEVAPHDVHYDDERRLWYCDIEVAPGASYSPFIRLALARYQPVSVSGAHLSNVVLADFMHLAPDRWLTVSPARDPRVRSVSVFGSSYTDSAGHDEASHAPSMSLHTQGSVVSLVPAAVSPTSVVEVWVERLDPDLGDDFGWTRDPDAVVGRDPDPATPAQPVSKRKVAQEVSKAQALVKERDLATLVSSGLIGRVHFFPPLWEGTVTLPEQSEGRRYRLVIAEYEEYLADGLFPYGKTPTAKDRRLVFVEHIELT